MSVPRICEECNTPLTGRQMLFCSKKCNMAHRRNGNKPAVTVTNLTVTKLECVTDDKPEQGGVVTDMDWWQGLFDCLPLGVTRPTNIPCYNDDTPGHEDYVGCVVDGEIVRPTAILPKDMNRQQLDTAIKAYPNDQWVNSPEYNELMSRLNSRSTAELEADGYSIPAWKVSA